MPGNKALVHIRQSSSIPAEVADSIENLAAYLLLAEEQQSSLNYLKKGCGVNSDSTKQLVLKAHANIERNRRGDRLIECTNLLTVLGKDDEKYLPTNLDSGYNELILEGDEAADTSNPIQVKSQRHEIFARWLVDTYGKEFLSRGTGVIDVAGGNGRISKTLSELGIQSTLLDPNPRCYPDDSRNEDGSEHSAATYALPFNVMPHPLNGDGSDLICRNDAISHTISNCSLICGLHPDQATEPIVTLALRLNVPFAVA